MAEKILNIAGLRKERGWSQEKLAAISGLSERTIQRIEKDGSCSLESKLALACAFELSPQDLLQTPGVNTLPTEHITDWSGAFGLLILGLVFPVIVFFTGTDGRWELVSFLTVMGLTVTISVMTHGFNSTHQLFKNTSWIVSHPSRVSGLNQFIIHANHVILIAYTIGLMASVVTGLTLVVHKQEMLGNMPYFAAVVVKPLVYALVFNEFWFRPYKRKMERMLSQQMAEDLPDGRHDDNDVDGTWD
ncbi:helix-turn-helix domain-containing protein [Marinicella sediminis]|uniref:Helix-turn-helix domain-containing protein n=1 Tax=Marinicella sediminis TaxID=1792834 RepID=A0ABV7J930_9GAMM|nr:helix-turn-helix transcriptional regulator [Marinicella sediminis]